MAESEAELKEILAREILDKIQKGKPVSYDQVKVIGDLDVNKLDQLLASLFSAMFLVSVGRTIIR